MPQEATTTWRHLRTAVAAKFETFLLVVYWPCLILFIAFAIYWSFHTPSAGKAIGALGAAGVLAALRGEKLEVSHRVVWALITLVLLVVEVRAINKDRHDADESHLADLKKQDADNAVVVQTIVDANQKQLQANQAHFDDTLAQMRGLGALSRTTIALSGNALQRITGGDEFCYVVPMTRFSNQPPTRWEFFVGNSGTVDLPSCDVRVVEMFKIGDTPEEALRKFEGHPMLKTGVLHSSRGYVISTGYFITVVDDTKYQLGITTPNHQYLEDIHFALDPSPNGGIRATCELRQVGILKVLWGGLNCPTMPVPKK